MMALIAATVLIPGDYFAINSTLSFEALAALGFPVSRVTELSAMVGTDVVRRSSNRWSSEKSLALMTRELLSTARSPGSR